MDADFRWLVGTAISVGLSLLGIIVVAFRNLAGRISAGDRDLHQKIDDVKEKYARRDDVEGHIKRFSESLRETRDEMRENHRQTMEALQKK